MSRILLVLLGAVACSGFTPSLSLAAENEMVANPRYVHWANFKPGTTVTQIEKTTFPDATAKLLTPDGVDVKEITYKLLQVTPEKVVVETVVVEHDFISIIEQAPTKITYPAKLLKKHLEAVMRQANAKKGEETLDVLGKSIPCNTIDGAYKEGDDQIERKMWFSKEVPGGIVKQTRSTSRDGHLVADTIITLKSFKAE